MIAQINGISKTLMERFYQYFAKLLRKKKYSSWRHRFATGAS
jgi:hypothetical protein